MSFAKLGLSQEMVTVVKSFGFETPTAIQSKAIPIALKGRDLIGIAETGSGKTASYLLPVIERLSYESDTRALVIAPTRELALQIEKVANELGAEFDMLAVAVIGGVRANAQVEKLRRGVDIIVATPGRLLDYMRSGIVSLGDVSELVLDEADRLLDMGFLPDVRRILQQLPRDRHSMLFSATFNREIELLAHEFMRSPETIELGRRATPVTTVEQVAYSVMGHHKTPLLIRLLSEHMEGQSLVFTRTKRGADKLAQALKVNGHSVDVMHADRTQGQRQAALERFRTGKVKVLVATDIAARGIDVEDVAFVVNYDVPATTDDYVHRVGRTARAGRKGTAVTLISPLEELQLRDIEHTTSQPIERRSLENFNDGRSPDAAAAIVETLKAGAAGAGGRARSFGGRRRR